MMHANIEAEGEVLGALLYDPERVHEMNERGLRAAHFTDRFLHALYASLESIAGLGVPITDATLFDAIRTHGFLDEGAFIVRCEELRDVARSSAHLCHHADIVIEHAQWRELGAACKAKALFIEENSPQYGSAQEAAAELACALESIVGASPRNDRAGPVLVRMEDVKPERIEWLWPNRFAIGKLSLCAGDPKLGKSTVATDIAARTTRAAAWPDGASGLQEPGSVLILSAEDDPADTIRPRLDAARADASRVFVLQAVRDQRANAERLFSLEHDIPQLEAALAKMTNPKLIIIDPISAYMGNVNSHNNAEVRGVLAPLAAFAAKHRVAVLVVTHLNKGLGPAQHRTMGSLAFTAAPRSVWLVAEDPNNASQRFLLPNGSNIGEPVGGLAFSISKRPDELAAYVAWESGAVNLSASEVLDAQSSVRTEGKALAQATQFLRDELADGPVAVSEIKASAKDAGISWRTVERAKEALGVLSRKRKGPVRDGGGWDWLLPDAPADEPPTTTAEDRQESPDSTNLADLAAFDPQRADGRFSDRPHANGCEHRQDRQAGECSANVAR